MRSDWDVIVVGGGNAALCAAMAASDIGARVLILERALPAFRGGNTRHVRNIRDAHLTSDRFVSGSYEVDEFARDLRGVTGDDGDQALTRFLIEQSLDIAAWASEHGARWQGPLRGTLGLARTNRFFLGGGKSLLNGYYRTADKRGVSIAYESSVTDFEFDGLRCTGVIFTQGGDGMGRVSGRSVVVASGGFEGNKQWLRKYWGAGADNFIIRGSRLNDGLVLERLFDHGACSVADPTRFHGIAVDARAPEYDAGILSRLDAIPYGIVVNSQGRRFYDEGEDIWPKRYAIWGRLIAEQPDQLAYVVLDEKAIDRFIPPLYPPIVGRSIEELALELGLDVRSLQTTVTEFNDHVVEGVFVDGELDGCHTTGLDPQKSNWARPLDTPPYYAFPLRPGITFTFHGVRVDGSARVVSDRGPFENIYAAGETMAGNVLTTGYLAGIGMTIGSVFGRHAGREAARP